MDDAKPVANAEEAFDVAVNAQKRAQDNGRKIDLVREDVGNVSRLLVEMTAAMKSNPATAKLVPEFAREDTSEIHFKEIKNLEWSETPTGTQHLTLGSGIWKKIAPKLKTMLKALGLMASAWIAAKVHSHFPQVSELLKQLVTK